MTDHFVKECVETQKVYLLTCDKGFAVSSSEIYFLEEEETPLEVICFWSNSELAKDAAKNNWLDYQPDFIELKDFLEQWLVGMFEEVSVAGINFNSDNVGEEIEPLELLLKFIQELEKTDTTIQWDKFESTEEFREIIIENLDNNYQ